MHRKSLEKRPKSFQTRMLTSWETFHFILIRNQSLRGEELHPYKFVWSPKKHENYKTIFLYAIWCILELKTTTKWSNTNAMRLISKCVNISGLSIADLKHLPKKRNFAHDDFYRNIFLFSIFDFPTNENNCSKLLFRSISWRIPSERVGVEGMPKNRVC